MEQTMEEQTQQVNVKAPEFMKTAENGWFTILEAQFHPRNVTAIMTKFYTVVSYLLAEEVAKLPNAMLESQDYEKLNQTLIKPHKKTKLELHEKCRQQQF